MAEPQKTLDQSLGDLLQSVGVAPDTERPGIAAAAERFQPCELWHRIRDEFDVLLSILDTVGKWLPWARQLANVLRIVQRILDQLCPR